MVTENNQEPSIAYQCIQRRKTQTTHVKIATKTEKIDAIEMKYKAVLT